MNYEYLVFPVFQTDTADETQRHLTMHGKVGYKLVNKLDGSVPEINHYLILEREQQENAL